MPGRRLTGDSADLVDRLAKMKATGNGYVTGYDSKGTKHDLARRPSAASGKVDCMLEQPNSGDILGETAVDRTVWVGIITKASSSLVLMPNSILKKPQFNPCKIPHPLPQAWQTFLFQSLRMSVESYCHSKF